MLTVPSTQESASEIYRRYKLDELVRLRTMSRRYFMNSLTSKALALVEDSSSLDPCDLPLLSSSTWLPLSRRHYLNYRLGNPLIASRRGLPDVPTRMLYDKRLADLIAEQREASRRADALLLSDYLGTSKALLPPSPEELDLIAYDDAATANTTDDANDNEDEEIDETEEESRKRRARERDAYKERVRILNQLRSYRRRFGPSRVMTRTMNRLLYDL